jgi:hypothetical protein
MQPMLSSGILDGFHRIRSPPFGTPAPAGFYAGKASAAECGFGAKTIMIRHHTIISGTGRAGTTFLVQLFTVLGLDTGFAGAASDINENCNAGMEWDIRSEDAPYLIKSPWLCDYLDSVLSGGEIAIDCALIPVRDLFCAAESRRDVERRTDADLFPAGIPGGLWHTDEPEKQESILTEQFYRILHTLTRHDIPTVLLDFPRIVRDPHYLFKKIGSVIHGMEFGTFVSAFHKVVRPELVHSFRRDAVPLAAAC